jgi:hypothetical protein
MGEFENFTTDELNDMLQVEQMRVNNQERTMSIIGELLSRIERDDYDELNDMLHAEQMHAEQIHLNNQERTMPPTSDTLDQILDNEEEM